jgi:hypothetical protein
MIVGCFGSFSTRFQSKTGGLRAKTPRKKIKILESSKRCGTWAIFGITHLGSLRAANKFPLPIVIQSKDYWFLRDIRQWHTMETQRMQRYSDNWVAREIVREYFADILTSADLEDIECELRDAIYPYETE